MVSTVYNLHISGGPMHAACGIGEDRRADVCLPARSVRLEIDERRTAFFGVLEERAASVFEGVSRREDNARVARLRNHVATIMSINFQTR
jgi:hypothetical protein